MRDLLTMRKSIFQNPTRENEGKSGMPPTTKSKNHSIRTQRKL